MLIDEIKKKSSYISLLMFLVINLVLVGKELPFKIVLITLLFVAMVITGYIQKENTKEIISYFIYFNNDKVSKKISGGLSLLAWVFISASIFILNLGFSWFARWLILIFAFFVIASATLIFFDLARSSNAILNKLKVVIGGIISLLYFAASACAASYFLQNSNMNLNNSPLLEMGLKLVFFVIALFIILQPISFAVFIAISNKLTGHQAWTSLGVLTVTSLLFFAAPRWADYIIVQVQDWTTASEWHTSASCGNLKIGESQEKYFGFNTDKYTVYFSSRNGTWGFEEIKCTKDEKNQDSFTRVPITIFDIPVIIEDA